jgi:transcriptional regulator GlxA family with amidase domain
MIPDSATVTNRAPPRGGDASNPAEVADLIQAVPRVAETRSFKLQNDGRADAEPDPGKDRQRTPGTLLAPWRAKKLDRFIEENLDRKLNLEILAPLVRLSCSHFARACKNTFGLPPRELVIRRRVERTQALMRETRMPLSQVALACGFADQAHFSRMFRRVAGTTPREWRRDNVSSSH